MHNEEEREPASRRRYKLDMKKIIFIVVAFALLYLLYDFLFARYLPEDRVFYKVAGASLLMLLPVGVLNGIRYRWRELRLINSSENPQLRDGERVAVVGTLRPEGHLLTSPFTHTECISYSYNIYIWKPNPGGKSRSQVYEYSGKAQTPSVLYTSTGNIRLLNYMEGTKKETFEPQDPIVGENARQYLESTAFEEHETFDWARPTAFLKEIILDSQGSTKRDWKITEERLELEGRTLEETILLPGKQYTIIGVWSAERMGIYSDPLGKGDISVLEGDSKEAAHSMKAKMMFSGIIAAILIAFVNFFVYGFLAD